MLRFRDDGHGTRWWTSLVPIIAVAVAIWLSYLPLRPRWDASSGVAPTSSATR